MIAAAGGRWLVATAGGRWYHCGVPFDSHMAEGKKLYWRSLLLLLNKLSLALLLALVLDRLLATPSAIMEVAASQPSVPAAGPTIITAPHQWYHAWYDSFFLL